MLLAHLSKNFRRCSSLWEGNKPSQIVLCGQEDASRCHLKRFSFGAVCQDAKASSEVQARRVVENLKKAGKITLRSTTPLAAPLTYPDLVEQSEIGLLAREKSAGHLFRESLGAMSSGVFAGGACELRAGARKLGLIDTLKIRRPLNEVPRLGALSSTARSSPGLRRLQIVGAYSPGPAPRSGRGTSALMPRQPPSPDDVYLPRSLIMDKEVITRTSGRRLGYVNQLYVDPARLEVVSVYLRQGATSLGASNSDHVMISSLRQIGDVVLVHDESALLDPPADEMFGYIKLVGTEVQTEDGTPLGKVRDFVFNPDNGQIVNIRYDALGIPSIPQSLLSCYTLSWEDVVAVGPTKTIVRRGAERRAIKENDGWVSEYVSALVNALAGVTDDNEGASMAGSESYRSDPAYAAWYQQHAAAYEQYYGQKLQKPIVAATPPPQERPPQQVRRRPQQPMALPPPRSVPYKQAMQPQEQERRRQPAMQPNAPVRERMYAGAGSGEMQRQARPGPPQQSSSQLRSPPGNPAQRPAGSPMAGAARPMGETRTPQQSARSRAGGNGPPVEQQPRSDPLPPRAPVIEPDAVISGGYQRGPGPASGAGRAVPADFSRKSVDSTKDSMPSRSYKVPKNTQLPSGPP